MWTTVTGHANIIIAPSVGYFSGRNSNQNKHAQKFQKLKAQTEASDIVAKVKLKKKE